MESDITMTQTSEFPKIIQDGGCGNWYVLADSEGEARAAAVANWGDEVRGVEPVGWMGRVPYPDGFDSPEEWAQSSDYCDEWWEGMQAPVNDKQIANLKRAWAVEFVPYQPPVIDHPDAR